eukprot:TRINITY_DN5735_c0_g2_i18.p1 TRINITY_DN5735_c0_g2~~TRINITY_DN5735_c0_g2_i18.p1  ORF type:complete len:422 (+),score=76.23 TRINITY_DN5735_c0_g2_i18:313-1578(+)
MLNSEHLLVDGAIQRNQARNDLHDQMSLLIDHTKQTGFSASLINVTQHCLSSKELYLYSDGFGSQKLSEGCGFSVFISEMGATLGLTDQAAKDLSIAADAVYKSQLISGGVACSISTVYNNIGVGLLVLSSSGSVSFETPVSAIVVQSVTQETIPREIALGVSNVNVAFPTRISLGEESQAQLWTILYLSNPHATSMQRRSVLSVEFRTLNGSHIPISLNESSILITFPATDENTPETAVPDQSEQSMYDRSSIKSKCIDLHPVCGFWQPSFGLWNASDISYGIQTSQLGLQVVACNTSHLTDFAVYLAPTERVPGCGDSWISDQYLLFVIFSTIYSACFLYVSHRCYEIFRLSSWRSYKMNPTSEWTHSLSLVLVIVRLLFMYLGVMDAVDSAPDSFVIFILSLPHLLTFTIFSLMVFVW